MTASATARNFVAPVVRWTYRLRVHGGHRCPPRGPLLVVAPHGGFLDATVIATCLPRPVDVLVEAGALTTVGARIPGRIVVDAAEPRAALRTALDRLGEGSAVGAWAGGGLERAAGYLAAGSHAPILPVVVLGGSGRHPGDPPSWRSVIDVVIGEPFPAPVAEDPLERSGLLQTAESIRQHVADLQRSAVVRTGRADGVAVAPELSAPDNGRL